MLKLGKVISKKSSTVVTIYKFDFEHMQWSNVPVEAEFLVAETPFASGGFRRAYKATSITEGFKEVTWVVKKYLKSASEIIKATQETEESHTKKSVQMHYVARNFASDMLYTLILLKLFHSMTVYRDLQINHITCSNYITLKV